MKNSILTTMGLLLAMQASAQKITEQKVFEKDNRVTVSFTVNMDKIPTNRKVIFTPVLYNGSQSESLKPIVIVGRNKAISEKRIGKTDFLKNRKSQSIPYIVSVPYQSWMSEVSLRIDRKTESCCTEEVLSPLAVVTDKPIRYDVELAKVEPIAPVITPIQKLDIEAPFLYPMSEYVAIKENFDVMRAEGALIVRFKQGGTVIDPNFSDNRKSLEQVRKVMELIESDPQASLGKIVLAGASSPEGSAAKNEELSQRRADALKRYLGADINSTSNLFEVINIGEDWIGLRKMVEASTMQYKQEVLDIIDNYTVSQGREKKLMDLKWGRPYNYMLEHFFPSLRSAGYIHIFYDSKPSPDYTTINESIEQYNRQEYKDALVRLEGIQPTATTEEIRGVCQMMLGQYDKAEALLMNAKKLGSTRAVGYLEQLSKLRKVELNK